MALREVLASFGVEFDKEGNLDKGDKKINALTEQLLGFGKTLVGAFAVTEIVKWGKTIIDQGDHLGETAERLDVSTTALQQWQYAAKLSGVEADELTASLQRLGAGLSEAAAGGGQAATFKKLGVDLKRTDGTLKSSIEAFEEAGLAIGALEDPTEAAGLAANLFGKQYARLLPLFRQGPAGIAQLKKEFDELGGGFSPEFIKQSEEVNDNLDRLGVSFKSVSVQILSEALPGILELSRGAVVLAKRFIEWVKGTKAIQSGLAVLAGNGVASLIAKVGGLGKALTMLGRLAMRTLAPFLALEDLLVFFAGGRSLIGRGLDKMFGSGAGEEARAAILKWFNDLKTVVVNDVLPAIKSFTESDLFKGSAKAGLDAILAVLSAIGVAITDNEKRAQALVATLQKSAAALGLGPGQEEAAAALEAGKPENRKELTTGESVTRKLVTTIFGDPLDDPEVKADAERNRQTLAKRKTVLADAAPVTAVLDRIAPPAAAQPAQATASYYDASRATASLPGGARTTNNNVVNNNTISPSVVNNVTVNGSEEVGNRVNRAIQRGAREVNLRAIRDALVPTPG